MDADVRLAAAEGGRDQESRPPALGEALNNGDPAMQYQAVLSLKRTTGKDLGDNVDGWQRYVKGEPPAHWPRRWPNAIRRLFANLRITSNHDRVAVASNRKAVV